MTAALELGERWRTRWRVLRAGRGGGGGLLWQPATRGAGSAVRGHPILAGVWHLAGHYVETEADPWDIVPPSVPFEMQVHGQGWLDDVLAAGGPEARAAARGWVLRWARRFGRGEGRGWDPALTGRRLLRWIDHASALTDGMAPRERQAFAAHLQVHAGYLAEAWREAPAGLPRMEALAGLLYGGMTLAGREALAGMAADGLVAAAESDIGPDGGIPSRNPEALLETTLLLGWCTTLLAAAGAVPEPLGVALGRAREALRSLRHADGGLARFHGGGRGLPGRLEQALGGGDGRFGSAPAARVMGFLPVRQGGTTLVADAAAPPEGAASGSAHASTLAFEMTCGPSPLVVNCGPGGAFGPEWHRAGRATASHSTLQVGAVSSARIGAPVAQGGRRIAPLVQGPAIVRCERDDGPRGTTLTLSHDGYAPSHGLVHLRRLVLAADGCGLIGEDALHAPTQADRARLQAAQAAEAAEGDGGVPFHIRFHLHPDSEATLDPEDGSVLVALTSGERWRFRAGEGVAVSVEASVHLEPGRRKPRPAQQVVLFGRVSAYAATVGWTLAREAGPTDAHGGESEDQAE